MSLATADPQALRASLRRLLVVFLVVALASGVWYWTLFFKDVSHRDSEASRVCQRKLSAGVVRHEDLERCERAERKRILADSPFFPYYLGPVVLGSVGVILFLGIFIRARPLMRNRKDSTTRDG